MKKRYTFLLFSLITRCLLTIYLSACRDEDEFIPLKIFSIEPVEALIGDTIAIVGEGFSPGIQYNRVAFAGYETFVLPLKNSTERQLHVVVPEGALTGPVSVNLFDEEIAEFPLSIRQPIIESIEPAEGVFNDTIRIRGQNFQPDHAHNIVRFSRGPGLLSSPATVIGGGNGFLIALVSTGAVTGPVHVGGIPGPEFTVQPPSITALEPEEGIVGDTVTIRGFGFGMGLAGTIDIFFKGSAQQDIIATIVPGGSSRAIQVKVPEGAQDGPLYMQYGAQGSSVELTSPQFFKVFPSMTGISPRSGIAGTTVTVKGFNFGTTPGTIDLKLNGLPIAPIKVSERELEFRVPAGASSGPLSLSVNGRTSPSVKAFEISSDGTPVIFEITPSSGPVGSLVVINGDYFSPTPTENKVHFTKDGGGTVEGEVINASVTQLTVKVPVGAASGEITVTKDGKTGIGTSFTLTNRALPVIASISPAMAPHSNNVTILGANFGEFAKDVRVQYSGCGTNYDMPLVSFSSTQLVATLPPPVLQTDQGNGIIITTEYPACEGLIRVILYSQQSNAATVTISGTPSITSLSSNSGFAGSQLILTGVSFHNVESKNIVTFSNGTVTAEASIVNPLDGVLNRVNVFVPDLAPGLYNINLTAFGNGSNNVSFEIREKPVAVKNVFYAVNNVPVPDPNGGSSTVQGLQIRKAVFDPPTELVIYERNPVNSLRAMVVDIAGSKVYYATTTRILGRSNLNNTGNETVYTQTTPTTNILDITLDVGAGKLYWTTGNIIMSINASGGTPDPVVYTAASGIVITSIMYEPSAGKLYFFERLSTATTGDIISINTDGTGRTVLRPSVPAVIDMKIDVGAGKLFYTTSSPPSSSLGATPINIFQANLDGSGSPTLYLPFGGTTTVSGSGVRVSGISLDLNDKYVYFIANLSSPGTGIYRMRYDGAVIPGTDPPALAERVYQVLGGTSPLGTGLGFASGLAVENASGATQRVRMNLTLEFLNTEDE
jgi:hypothetical protein